MYLCPCHVPVLVPVRAPFPVLVPAHVPVSASVSLLMLIYIYTMATVTAEAGPCPLPPSDLSSPPPEVVKKRWATFLHSFVFCSLLWISFIEDGRKHVSL